jgi:hypothetical protein
MQVMNEQLRTYLDEQAQRLDESVEQALEITNGNAIRALRAVLIANTFLHDENERIGAQISMGFTRGRVRKPRASC